MSDSGWIAVDLDRTLAHYDVWRGPTHIGAPIPLMVERVKLWLSEGKDVRIFTARIAHHDVGIVRAIEDWCIEHIGQALPVTNTKDWNTLEIWDDRAVQVVPNSGERVDGDE